MALWDVFLPDVLAHVPDAPDPLARQALRRASRMFCRRSRAWQAWCATSSAGSGQYTITLPSGSSVVRIERVTVDRRPLEVVPFHWNEYDPITYADEADVGVVSDDLDTLLVTGPVISGDVRALLALMPTRAATGVSDFVAERYLEAIANGAASDLLRTTGANWYDPQRASICEGVFQAGIATACDDVSKWHTSSRPRARINWC